MSKKSYKRNQNRLYREIKRRILAEQNLLKPVKFATCERKIDTLKIRQLIPCHIIRDCEDDYVKGLMAKRMAQKLVEDGYITFFQNYNEKFAPIEDHVELEARLDVVRPMELT